MSRTKLPKLYKRTWLNSDRGTAYCVIEAEVEKVTYGKRKGGTDCCATFEIKDCNRQASIEFYYYNAKDYQKRLTKIRRLIDNLEELEAFMRANPPLPPPDKVNETKAKKKAPRKPVEPLPELLLTERRPDPASLNGSTEKPLRKASVIDIAPVTLRPTLAGLPKKIPNETK